MIEIVIEKKYVQIISQVMNADEVQVVNERHNVKLYVTATSAEIAKFQAAYNKHDAQSQDGLMKMVDHFLRRELAKNKVDRCVCEW